MSKPAANIPVRNSNEEEAQILAFAKTVRAVIESIPEAQRPAVFALVEDLLKKAPEPPRRGSDLLLNVYQLFKEKPRTEHTAAAVIEALADKGVATSEPKPIYNALQYLHQRRAIIRVAYNKYVFSDGSVQRTDIEKGGEMEY